MNPAQTTLIHAAELIEDLARRHQISQLEAIQPHWENELDIRAAYDYELQDALTTALELRLLAKRINDGQIAVPPAPSLTKGE